MVGIDRFTPPHPWGSTHGETRVTRLAIGEGREYVPLVRRSHALWRELEAEANVRLLTQPGIVVLAQPSSPFLRETRAAAREYGIDHEDLDAAEVRARFPMFAVGERIDAYFEPEGGYVRPEAAVTAQLDLARRGGARLRLGERVLAWSVTPGGVTVTTDRDTYSAEHLVLCAGPWLPELVPEVHDVVAVYRQLLYWFPVTRGYPQLRDMPVFVWEFGEERPGFVHLDGFYGFPAVDGPAGGVKVATESFARTTRPDGRQHPATPAEIAGMRERCIGPCLPWLGTEPLRTASCLYTSTRGSRFVIDRHPEHDAVLILSACSGHGFKHSPAIGQAVAQWLTTGRRGVDLEPFSFARAQRGESDSFAG